MEALEDGSILVAFTGPFSIIVKFSPDGVKITQDGRLFTDAISPGFNFWAGAMALHPSGLVIVCDYNNVNPPAVFTQHGFSLGFLNSAVPHTCMDIAFQPGPIALLSEMSLLSSVVTAGMRRLIYWERRANALIPRAVSTTPMQGTHPIFL